MIAAAVVVFSAGRPPGAPAGQLPDCRPNVTEDPRAIHARVAAVQAEPAAVLPKIELARCFDLTWQFAQVEQAIQQAQEAFEAELLARLPKPPARAGLPLAVVDVPAPQRLSGTPPQYPEDARAADAAGIVIVEVRVDREGRVWDPRVVRSVKGLDAAAISAIKTWRYARPLVSVPATGVRMYLPIKFGHVSGLQPGDYLEIAEFYYSQGEHQMVRGGLQAAMTAARAEMARYGPIHDMNVLIGTPAFEAPEVRKQFAPQYTSRAKREKITGDMELLLLIDRKGVAGRASVVRPLPYLNIVGQEAAIRWQFTPAVLNGQPVSVIAPLTMSFRLY